MAAENRRRSAGPGMGALPWSRRWLHAVGPVIMLCGIAGCTVTVARLPSPNAAPPPPTIEDVVEALDVIKLQIVVLAEDIDHAREHTAGEHAASSDDGFLDSTLFKILILAAVGGIGAGARPGYDKIREMRGGGE